MPASEPITVARDLAIVLIFFITPAQWLKTEHCLLSEVRSPVEVSSRGGMGWRWRGVQEGGDICTPVAGFMLLCGRGQHNVVERTVPIN